MATRTNPQAQMLFPCLQYRLSLYKERSTHVL